METYVYGIVLITLIAILFIGLFGFLFLNTKTVYDYTSYVIDKNDVYYDTKVVEICKENGVDGWQLIQVIDGLNNITLIFMKSYSKSKIFK